MSKKEAEVEEVEGLTVDDEGGVQVDMSGVDETGDFPVIPPRIYNAEVVSCDYSLSQANNNPMWTIRLSITDDDDHEGRTLFSHIVFAAKTMARAKKTLITLGLPELAESKFNPEDEEVMEKLLGKTCRIRVGVKTYQGERRNDVKAIMAGGGRSSGDFV